MNRLRRAALLAATMVLSTPALAADQPPPSGVVSLSSSASVEVTKDLMSITLTTTRDGADANAVQAALKQALDAALAEARRAVKPGQVEVHTGNFSLYPHYTNKGQMSGWQGTAELVVEGRDMPALGQLAGRISTLTIARVVYALSREQREKSEAEVMSQAIARYRANASAVAREFGYAGYTIREVGVTANEPSGGPVPLMRAQAMTAQDASALPVEAGKAIVTVSVAGTVQLTR